MTKNIQFYIFNDFLKKNCTTGTKIVRRLHKIMCLSSSILNSVKGNKFFPNFITIALVHKVIKTSQLFVQTDRRTDIIKSTRV